MTTCSPLFTIEAGPSQERKETEKGKDVAERHHKRIQF